LSSLGDVLGRIRLLQTEDALSVEVELSKTSGPPTKEVGLLYILLAKPLGLDILVAGLSFGLSKPCLR
jgi:hypothetical protein